MKNNGNRSREICRFRWNKHYHETKHLHEMGETTVFLTLRLQFIPPFLLLEGLINISLHVKDHTKLRAVSLQESCLITATYMHK